MAFPTAAQLTDRIYRDWLNPPDLQPARLLLAEALDASETDVTYDDVLLHPEEREQLIGPGVVVEWDLERFLVTAVNTTTKVLTVVRGYDYTTAATHAINTVGTISPEYSRVKVYDAMVATVDALWPRVWTIGTREADYETPYTTLADDVRSLVEVRDTNGVPVGFTEMKDFPGAGEVSVRIHDATGGSFYYTYRQKIDPPTDPDQVLNALGVTPRLEKIVEVSTVAEVAAGMDLSRATVDHLTQALEHQGFPVGSGASLRNSLLRYRDFLIEEHAAGILDRSLPASVQYHSPLTGKPGF